MRAFLLMGILLTAQAAAQDTNRPNILLAIADDWGWPHAGALGDTVVRTPTFDRLAAGGILFENAFVSSPSCTPSRAALLTGRYHWGLEESANLWSTLQLKFRTYPEWLEAAGYHVGSWRKAWGPGRIEPGGRSVNPGGRRYKNLGTFLDAKKSAQPFCFWLGTSDPHRPYEAGTGQEAGYDVDAIEVPEFYPDAREIRSDIADYYFEVERFDRDVGQALEELERRGLLENTIVIMTSDHGMPFPRCKSNLYDWGTRVPLVVKWGSRLKSGRRDALVSLVDIAPTILEAASLEVPREMSGHSLMPLLKSDAAPWRDFVLFGKERHTPCQSPPSWAGYPCRAIRTKDHLYIENLFPGLWPAGVPEEGGSTRGPGLSDCDGGPTKSYLVAHREDAPRYWDLSFAKRPAEELYVVAEDRDQVRNRADAPELQSIKSALARRLGEELRRTGDPRALGEDAHFEDTPYYGGTKADKRAWDGVK
ncbi:MAG: sulfatase [Planctomycetota bacterium]